MFPFRKFVFQTFVNLFISNGINAKKLQINNTYSLGFATVSYSFASAYEGQEHRNNHPALLLNEK